MRIAFDVKGTINGPDHDKVLKLFHALQAMGHEMFVWSTFIGYAVDAISEHNLKAESMWKKSLSELNEWGMEPMDVCIEDDSSQTWLGSKKIILVSDLPDDIEAFAKQIGA